MHVLHMCDSSLEGDYFRNIAIGMTQKGVRITLAELGEGTAPTWLLSIPGVEYVSFGAKGKISQFRTVDRLRRMLAERHVNILHTHLFYSGLIGVLGRRPGTLVALMRHHTGVVRMLGSRFHVGADRWMAMRADRVLTVSNAAREYMRNVDGIDREIDVVHLGFDLEWLAPNAASRQEIRSELGIAEDDFLIGYVANFAPGKGHIELLRAFRSVVAAVPKARLLLAGRGELDDVKAAGLEMPAGSVIFAGWRSDIPKCLNALDVFVQPSLSEAFSQVIIEAMATSLPVIATDVGGASEAIVEGESGVLIPAGDPDAIAAAVIELAGDPEKRAALGKAARGRTLQKFSAEKMVDKQYELYRSWLASK